MKVDEQFIDSTILEEGFNLSTLYCFYDDMLNLKSTLEELRDTAIDMRLKKDAVDAERKLYYLTGNIEIVLGVISMKEMTIFEFTEFGELCWN